MRRRQLSSRHRLAEMDASYGAYDEHPLDEPDGWGDLASWRRAAGSSGEMSTGIQGTGSQGTDT